MLDNTTGGNIDTTEPTYTYPVVNPTYVYPYVVYPYPNGGVCPGCGRCRVCGGYGFQPWRPYGNTW